MEYIALNDLPLLAMEYCSRGDLRKVRLGKRWLVQVLSRSDLAELRRFTQIRCRLDRTMLVCSRC